MPPRICSSTCLGLMTRPQSSTIRTLQTVTRPVSGSPPVRASCHRAIHSPDNRRCGRDRPDPCAARCCTRRKRLVHTPHGCPSAPNPRPLRRLCSRVQACHPSRGLPGPSQFLLGCARGKQAVCLPVKTGLERIGRPRPMGVFKGGNVLIDRAIRQGHQRRCGERCELW